MTSACLLELLVQSPAGKPRYSEVTEFQDLIRSNSSLQIDLVQRKKLLFDCVREVVEAHEKNEKIWAWEKQPGKETSINHPLHLDFTASTQEWNDLKRESRKIGLEIGEAILEEMITETVTDMISSKQYMINFQNLLSTCAEIGCFPICIV